MSNCDDVSWKGVQALAPDLAFLAETEASILNGREQRALDAINKISNGEDRIGRVGDHGPKNLHFIVKATRLCNLRCSYCNAWREGPDQVMPFEILAKVILEAMRTPGLSSVYFVWHGGETTLLSQRYFEKALWLQEYFRVDGRLVQNAIQTNATRIDDRWAQFFRAAGFSVGVSLDISKAAHDANRVFADGTGSWDAAVAGLALLRSNEVSHGILAVLTPEVVARGAHWFLDCAVATGVRQLAILNALPRNGDGEDFAGSYLPWDAYLRFLRDLFPIWRADYAQAITIRELNSLFEIIGGSQSRLCIFAGNCMGSYLTIEPDGTVSACDKYIGLGDYVFGNIEMMSLPEILAAAAPVSAKSASIQRQTSFQQCENWMYCRGGCPHDVLLNDRFSTETGGCCGLSELIDDMKAYHQSLQ